MLRKLLVISCAITSLAHSSEDIQQKQEETPECIILTQTVTHIRPIQEIILGYVNNWLKLKQLTLQQCSMQMGKLSQLFFQPDTPILTRISYRTEKNNNIGEKSINIETRGQQPTIFRTGAIFTQGTIKITPVAPDAFCIYNANKQIDYTTGAFAISPNIIAFMNRDMGIICIDIKTGEYIILPKNPGDRYCFVSALKFSADAHYLAAGSRDGTVDVWDIQTQQRAYNFANQNKAEVHSLAIHDKYLFSADQNGDVNLWDWQEQKHINTLAHYPVPATALAVSSNGQYLAVSTTNTPITKQTTAGVKQNSQPDSDQIDIYANEYFILKK